MWWGEVGKSGEFLGLYGGWGKERKVHWMRENIQHTFLKRGHRNNSL
jgi:hypothetical protein